MLTILPTPSSSLWTRLDFPALDLPIGHDHRDFLGRNRKLTGTSKYPRPSRRDQVPFSGTPTKEFHFGGQRFIPLYPCVAFETQNFGHVIQRLWDHMVYGKE